MARNDQELPAMVGDGVEVVKIKAVEEAFDELLGHRTRRMNAAEKEQAASAVLVALFHKHNLKVYNYDDKKYTLATIEKVKLAPKEEDE
jgi:hypothetical protein